MNDILEKINEVFKNIFEKKDLVISEETSADDIEGWDSLQHVKILVMLEQEFHIEFDIDEIISMDNIGDMVRIIRDKI